MGGDKALAFSYVDLAQTAPASYQMILSLVQLAAGTGDMFGVKVPPMIVPPMSKLQPHLGPCGGAMWMDEDGLHSQDVEPFPGSALLSIPETMFLQMIFVTGFAEATIR